MRTTRLFLSLFAFGSDQTSQTSALEGACRSNSTHISWTQQHILKVESPITSTNNHRVTKTTTTCIYQTRSEAEQECLQYLKDNLMAFDLPFQETMGFSTSDDPSDGEADGLGNGLVGPTVTLALDAKELYEWTDALPKDMFQEYVLNYANFNEGRTNWRPLLVDALNFTNSDLWKNRQHRPLNVSSIVTWVNQVLWTRLGRNGKPIFFKSSQTPLIYDPMSIIAFGYASCTGTSILFSNALRAVGIASRVAGTPAWYGNASQGNHNWVEVYVPEERAWKFLEPSPALPTVDSLDRNPCERWFCDSSRYPASKVFAARLTKGPGCGPGEDCDQTTHFPLAWELSCKDVPGVDRTKYYADMCGRCVDDF
jgi:hypothetical protein